MKHIIAAPMFLIIRLTMLFLAALAWVGDKKVFKGMGGWPTDKEEIKEHYKCFTKN